MIRLEMNKNSHVTCLCSVDMGMTFHYRYYLLLVHFGKGCVHYLGWKHFLGFNVDSDMFIKQDSQESGKH